ncbi:MAG: hypothetical protein GF368_02030 [Candidatus Aenigmarchaeota archaeon]|nr:hypothetical protein [Candidatus Aenigmarchaeota archaeon]
MNILGISCFYHDSAACLIKDGKIVAGSEEERFSRKKHDTGFPFNAIKYCLKEGEIDVDEIDYIAFYEKPLLKFERILSSHLETFPKSFRAFVGSMPSWLNEKLRVPSIIRKKLKYKGEIIFVEHHEAHAGSTFLVSPFNEAAILTIDGVGEWTTTSTGFGKGNDISIKKEIHFPHSLGLLYSTVTAYLGFRVNNDEYKVMGLASYGEPKYVKNFRKIIDVKKDGSFRLNMDYFVYHHKMRMPSEKFVKEFGPMRKKGGEITQRHKDIAASLQRIVEETIFQILRNLHKETKCDNLCMAGGVALNSVSNGKILDNTPFKNVFIQPASSDAGGSLGAAMYLYNSILGNKREYIMEDIYLGPGFNTDEIRSFLKGNNIKFKEFKDDNKLLKKAADLIHKNNIVGFYQGRMEWGPRALGNRSILANPCNPEMKDVVNKRVKHREPFRPFAPVVTYEDYMDYFEAKTQVPFMLFVYPVRKNKRKLIPAVTHVDGTGRLQTIRKDWNPRYYQIIKEFEKLSGVPVLLNTSFNIRGEPIVCTPEDAYRCMMGTGIDYMVIDRFLVAREDNPKDKWTSWEGN